MTPALQVTELEQARQYFDRVRQLVTRTTAGVSEAQGKFKPAPDRWSIAEILEHMVVVHERVLARVQTQLQEAPAPAAGRDHKRIDAIVIEKIPDRSVKAQAPEVIRPTGTWTLPFSVDRLFEGYGQLLEFLESTPGLRDHVMDSPPLRVVTQGEYETMDGYQWVLTAAAHDERHLRQIEEVKADPAFPKA